MRSTPLSTTGAALAIAALLTSAAAPGARAHEAADAMAEAAAAFLAALDEDQRDQVSYQVEADERQQWHFVPKPFEGEEARTGLPMKHMRDDQRALAFALLNSGLSHRGFSQAVTIMSLEQVLWELENQAAHRDPGMYYVTIYGEPGAKAWGWRVEGHHLSVHFTVVGDQVSATPNFMATNPGEIRQGPRKGLQVLADEENLARELVNALDGEQREAAVFSDKAPRDILTSAETRVEPLEEAGILAGELNEAQQALLQQLIETYVHRVRPAIADDDLQKIEEAGFENIRFAWAGGLNKGEGHYYRVQGPTFLLEYANTQNDANHVHAVWRDFQGDFGADLLRQHYQQAHAPTAK